MGKLKSVQALKKMQALDDYIENHKLPRWNAGIKRVLSAYVDCMPENVETTGMERNLEYFEIESFNCRDAEKVLLAAIPGGYNGFSATRAIATIVEIFGDDCQVFIAREGSPCLYVKPGGAKSHLWLNGRVDLSRVADELSYVPSLSMFRLWWD